MELNRRTFSIAAVAVAGCACCGAAGLAWPVVAADAVATSGGVDVGAAADFPKDGAFDKLAKSSRIMLVRQRGRLYASAATCTHRDCVVRAVDNDLRCPCHGSRYDLTGRVTKGPAKHALPRYAISQTENGRIVVDPSQRFDESQWDDPRSYVNVG